MVSCSSVTSSFVNQRHCSQEEFWTNLTDTHTHTQYPKATKIEAQHIKSWVASRIRLKNGSFTLPYSVCTSNAVYSLIKQYIIHYHTTVSSGKQFFLSASPNRQRRNKMYKNYTCCYVFLTTPSIKSSVTLMCFCWVPYQKQLTFFNNSGL